MVKVMLNSKAVRQVLARKNKSQNWLAQRLGISSGFMAQLLASERCPSPNLRERILANFKEQRFDDLFTIKA